jgi:hypothetical protein
MKYVLQRIREERNIPQTITRRKANWIGYILRKNCFLKHVIVEKTEGKIEVTGRRGEHLSSYCMALRKREDTGN